MNSEYAQLSYNYAELIAINKGLKEEIQRLSAKLCKYEGHSLVVDVDGSSICEICGKTIYDSDRNPVW